MKKIKIVLIILLFAVFAPVTVSCAKNTDLPVDSFENTIETVKYGIVEVECLKPSFTKVSGSGFIISAAKTENSCVIITNYHVIKNAVESDYAVNVRFFGEEDFISATLKGYSDIFDVAVLTVDYLPEKYHEFQFKNENNLGEDVLSLGYVDGMLSAYSGIISLKDKYVKVNEDWRYVLETTAPAPLGTSGGPCLNKKGEVVGLNSANYAYDGLLGGVSYKIHANIVDELYKRIMDSEQVQKPALGIGVYNNYITVYYLNGEILINDQMFDVYLSGDGLLRVRKSNNFDFPVGAIIASINGEKTDLCGFIAQFCKTGPYTEIRVNII